MRWLQCLPGVAPGQGSAGEFSSGWREDALACADVVRHGEGCLGAVGVDDHHLVADSHVDDAGGGCLGGATVPEPSTINICGGRCALASGPDTGLSQGSLDTATAELVAHC